MALGIVDDAQFEKELERIAPLIIDTPKRGRKEGMQDVPDVVREIIGDTAIESGRQDAVELASFFDISPSSASAYAKGATSTASYNKPAKSLGKHIAKTKERISTRAQGLAIRALHNITDDKLESASATELIQVARGAATIVKDMEPPVQTQGIAANQTVQFVLHAPQMAKEDKFPVIDIRAQEETNKD